MKVVAAAKLRRAQERMSAARPFSAGLRTVLGSLAARAEEGIDHPLLHERPENNVLLLVVTADKGLSGAFNANIIKGAQAAIRDRGWQSVALIPIGKKGNDFFRRRPFDIRYDAVGVFQALSPDTARDIATVLIDEYTSERVDAVYAIFNEFRTVVQQTVRLERLLPIAREEFTEPTVDYIYEPSPERILGELLPKHIEFQIYRILLESAAAEHAARMTAMESASKNASEMIDSLTLTYNRVRQASITKELIEIVSGAAAQG